MCFKYLPPEVVALVYKPVPVAKIRTSIPINDVINLLVDFGLNFWIEQQVQDCIFKGTTCSVRAGKENVPNGDQQGLVYNN